MTPNRRVLREGDLEKEDPKNAKLIPLRLVLLNDMILLSYPRTKGGYRYFAHSLFNQTLQIADLGMNPISPIPHPSID